MKLILITILFTLFTNTKAGDSLKIYVFNVEQADSQLIVFPSGYSILIDCGEPGGTTNESGVNAIYLSNRLSSILGKKYIDVFVISHFHIDHTGSYQSGGIWYLLEKAGFTIGKFFRRDVGEYKGSSLSSCSKSSMDWKYAGTMSSHYTKFVCYATATNAQTKLSKVGQLAYRCSKSQIAPPDDGATVQFIIRDGMGIKDTNGKWLNRNSMNDDHPLDENVFSIGMRIVFGNFVYVTSGDLSGYDQSFPDTDWVYRDVETKVAPMMGEVDVAHVNHHGSYYSSNPTWCNTLKPTAVVCSRSTSLGPPQTQTLQHFKDVNAMVYTTGFADVDASFESHHVKMGDDIVITVAPNASTYTISRASGGYSGTHQVKMNKKAPVDCHALEDDL